jgi:hypothetical protein
MRCEGRHAEGVTVRCSTELGADEDVRSGFTTLSRVFFLTTEVESAESCRSVFSEGRQQIRSTGDRRAPKGSSSRAPPAALPFPVEPETFSMPADDRLGLDHHEGLPPVRPEANQGYPQEPVR